MDRDLAVSSAASYSGSPRFEYQVCYRDVWREVLRGFDANAEAVF
jgi:hypothetical protein